MPEEWFSSRKAQTITDPVQARLFLEDDDEDGSKRWRRSKNYEHDASFRIGDTGWSLDTGQIGSFLRTRCKYPLKVIQDVEEFVAEATGATAKTVSEVVEVPPESSMLGSWKLFLITGSSFLVSLSICTSHIDSSSIDTLIKL